MTRLLNVVILSRLFLPTSFVPRPFDLQEREPGIQSPLHYSWHDTIRKSRPITSNFKSVSIGYLMKRHTVRPQRLVLHFPKTVMSSPVSNWSALNMARSKAIFTIRHPSYPSICAYVTHVIFFRVCSWNSLGTRLIANQCTLQARTCVLRGR